MNVWVNTYIQTCKILGAKTHLTSLKNRNIAEDLPSFTKENNA